MPGSHEEQAKLTTPLPATRLVIRSSEFGSPRKAIRKHCLWCAGTTQEVRFCPCTDCPTWPHRFGRQPEKAAERGEVVDPQIANAAGWRENPENACRSLRRLAAVPGATLPEEA